MTVAFLRRVGIFLLTYLLTIRYDAMRATIFSCVQKLTGSQLNLPHGTKKNDKIKERRTKNELLRRNHAVRGVSPAGRKRVYGLVYLSDGKKVTEVNYWELHIRVWPDLFRDFVATTRPASFHRFQ